jgi:hypothetical protein
MSKKRLYGNSRSVPVLRTSIDMCSWIIRGSMRKFVFLNIKKMTTPSDIVKQLAGKEGRKSSSHYAQVSRAIAELESQHLVVCLNPKEKTGRFYELTRKGKEILKDIHKKGTHPA